MSLLNLANLNTLTASPGTFKSTRRMYYRPTQLTEALEILSSQAVTILAGGTDFYPSRVDRPIDAQVLDISRVEALRGVNVESNGIRIGAIATWRDVIDAGLPRWCDGLILAAREIGGAQIQNAATLVGNLCNASPAADGVPVLLALDAQVQICSRTSERLLPLSEFLLGPRRTALQAGELVTSIFLPAWSSRARANFMKLGARRYLLISIVMVAVTVDFDHAGCVERAAIAVGSCSPVALRIRSLEANLVGRTRSELSMLKVSDSFLAPLQPIDDVRASAEYRREAAARLIERTLAHCATQDTVPA
jgi:CO/xanthine dehydrogenase FAD-binding subunit